MNCRGACLLQACPIYYDINHVNANINYDVEETSLEVVAKRLKRDEILYVPPHDLVSASISEDVGEIIVEVLVKYLSKKYKEDFGANTNEVQEMSSLEDTMKRLAKEMSLLDNRESYLIIARP